MVRHYMWRLSKSPDGEIIFDWCDNDLVVTFHTTDDISKPEVDKLIEAGIVTRVYLAGANTMLAVKAQYIYAFIAYFETDVIISDLMRQLRLFAI